VRNSSSAAGKWQILDSTWAGYGGTQYAPTADQATEAEQDSIAAKIWDGGNGAGQWVCKG
jgi:muramidase (phage lysozyme)